MHTSKDEGGARRHGVAFSHQAIYPSPPRRHIASCLLSCLLFDTTCIVSALLVFSSLSARYVYINISYNPYRFYILIYVMLYLLPVKHKLSKGLCMNFMPY